jgi:uncharacterized protein YjdB
MKTKLFAPLLFIVCAIVLSSSDCTGPDSVRIDGVSVTPESITLPPGGTFELKITMTPFFANDQRGTLYVDDITKAVPTLLDPFTFLITVPLTATAGKALLTVVTKDGGFRATCVVTVDLAAVQAIAKPTTKLTLDPIIPPAGVPYPFGILK